MGVLSLVVAGVFIVPQMQKLSKLSTEFEQVRDDFDLMYKNISEMGALRSSVAEAEQVLAGQIASGVLEPLLGSYEMRALRLVAPHAQNAGVTLVADSVRCLPQLPIQTAESVTGHLYVRQPVEFAGKGSYAQIVAFINEIEEQMPLMSVSSLRIMGQQTPEEHVMLISLEWPVLADVKPVQGAVAN